MDKRDERKRTFRRSIEKSGLAVKSRVSRNPVTSMVATCLPAMWQPLLRGHDFYPGLFAERRKPHVNVKGKAQVRKCKATTNVACGGG